MTRLAVLSANLGGYDRPADWPALDAAPGFADPEVYRFDDATCPPRPKAMTSRLQCGLPKWFGWDLVRGCAVYLWIDASCAPTRIAVPYFVQALGDADLAVFAHPERATVQEEYEFIRARLQRPGETYLTSRYAGEWFDQQLERSVYGARLLASTAFIYRDTPAIRQLLTDVWLHKTRFCLHDQLAFSSLVQQAGTVRTHWIEESYLRCPALTFVRAGIRRSA